MNIRNKVMLVSMISACSVSAWATPNLQATCERGLEIKKPEAYAATPTFFNDDCSKVYVAPPLTGDVNLTSFMEHSNLGFCPAMEETQIREKESVNRINELNVRKDTLLAKYITPEWQDELNAAQDAVDDADQKVFEAEEALTYAEKSYDLAETEKMEAMDDYANCKDEWEEKSLLEDNFDTPLKDYCNNEITVYLDKKKAVSKARRDKLSATTGVSLAESSRKRAERKLDRLNSESDAVENRAVKIEGMITEAKNRVRTLYDEYKNLYAGLGNIQYESNWDAVVNSIATLNSSLGVTFEKLSIGETKVLISNHKQFVDPNSVLAEKSGLLSVSIPLLELYNYGTANMPGGLEQPETPIMSTLPHSFSGTGQFALALGCGIQKTGKHTFGNFVNVGLEYGYKVKARGGYKATYNLSSFYKVIKKVSSKNRWLFKRSTFSSTEIFEDKDLDFTIKFFKDAGGLDAFSPEDEQRIATAVKTDLYRKVLDMVGVRISTTAPDPVLPQSTPAYGIGAKLAYGRCSNIYRCVGGWVLIGIDGLAGTRSAETQFTQTQNKTVTETYTKDFFVDRHGFLSFSSVKR